MSDTTIIVISILVFLLIVFGVTAWLTFSYFPKKTTALARELAESVRNTLGMTPQVTVNQRVVFKRTNEILELAMIEQDFDVEHETSHKWMGSEKKVSLRGTYRAKIGFDLSRGFNIEVSRGGLFRPGRIILQLPRAEVLSIEPLEVQKTKASGLINWVTKRDIEAATRELTALAQDKASKLDMLEEAEKRIGNRLNQVLLPRLADTQYTHKVKFLEMKNKGGEPDPEEELLLLTDG